MEGAEGLFPRGTPRAQGERKPSFGVPADPGACGDSPFPGASRLLFWSPVGAFQAGPAPLYFSAFRTPSA